MRVTLRWRKARPISIPFEGIAEEQRTLPTALDVEPPEMPKVAEGPRRLPERPREEFVFSAFIDGVQRTVRLGAVQTPEGIEVPIYGAWIAAGVLFRSGRTPRMGPLRAWRVVAAPFRVLGEDPEAMVADLGEQLSAARMRALDQRETVEDPAALLHPSGGWIVADTSQAGLAGGGPSWTDVRNERLVRSRAMGRIAHLRQLLELAVLIGLRASAPDAPAWLRDLAFPEREEWWPAARAVLVDGPLLLSRRHRGMLERWAQQRGHRTDRDVPLERALLGQAAGLVKSHRLRPKDLATVLGLEEGWRSPAYAFSREVDIHGRALEEDMRADETLVYPDWHVTAYVRLRRRPGAPLEGLVRIDLHRWALQRPEAEEVPTEPRPLDPEEAAALDGWCAAVYWERLPRWGRDQPFPISLLEKALHARIPSPAVLAVALRMEGG